MSGLLTQAALSFAIMAVATWALCIGLRRRGIITRAGWPMVWGVGTAFALATLFRGWIRGEQVLP